MNADCIIALPQVTETQWGTRFQNVLASWTACWSTHETFTWGKLALRRWCSVFDHERRFCGRSDAQSIQVTDLSGGHSGDLEGTLSGMTVVALAFRSPLRGLEVVVDRPEYRRPFQTRR